MTVFSAHDGSIRGGVIVSRFAFAQQLGGRALVDKIVASLAPADRERLGASVSASAWYPFDTYERVDAALAATIGSGDGMFRALGEHSAVHNLSAAQRTFVRRGDPHGLLEHAATIYGLYYDTGYRTYERAGPRRAILRTLQSRTYSRTDCLTVVGWHEKAIAMCGGGRPRVTETRCRSRGDEMCEYVCEWA